MNLLNNIIFSIIFLLSSSVIALANDCYLFVESITGSHKVTRAVMISSEENNISPALLLSYLITENAKFKNLKLNSSGDVGLFQININYHDYSVNTLMDMNKNALIAGKILRGYLVFDPTIFGLSRYHSNTKKFNLKYRKRLLRNLKMVLEKKNSFQGCNY